jgi:hypothetical protein
MPRPTIVIYEIHEDSTSKDFLFKLLPILERLGYTEFLLEYTPQESLSDIQETMRAHLASVEARHQIFAQKPHLKQLACALGEVTEADLEQDRRAATRCELNLTLIRYLIENQDKWNYQGIDLPEIKGRANEVELLAGAAAAAIDRRREQHFAECVNATLEEKPMAGCVVLLGLGHFEVENALPENTIYVFPHSPDHITTLSRESQKWFNSFIDSARKKDGHVGSQTHLYTRETPEIFDSIISNIQLSVHPFLVRHWLNVESADTDSRAFLGLFKSPKVQTDRPIKDSKVIAASF